jgi:hypothetical protein
MRPSLLLHFSRVISAGQTFERGHLPGDRHRLQKYLQLFGWMIGRSQRVQGPDF